MTVRTASDHASVDALLQQGAHYLDVRTQQEYELGHVPGAYNIPLSHGDSAGLVDNPDFERTVQRAFVSDAPLVLGCHSGPRAQAAAARLARLGYSRINVHLDGWDGRRDAFGRKGVGWLESGRLASTAASPGRSYRELCAAKD